MGKIVVKLHKSKGEYGSFDYWSKLTDPKRKDKDKKKSTEDPTAGLMGMMKEMYDSGDDNMRKMIGETMLKQRNGELNKDNPGDLETSNTISAYQYTAIQRRGSHKIFEME